MVVFALKTLLADRGKLLIALTGVVFSLVLVNVQGGLFMGMVRKTTPLIDHGAADIWVGHRGMKNADITAEIPVAWADRIRGVSGVSHAEPYVVVGAMMQLASGDFEGILLVGADRDTLLGAPWVFSQGSAEQLRAPDAITIDRMDLSRLGNPQVGDVFEINGQRARVAGVTDGILGFITTPYVFTTLEKARAFGRVPPDFCSYFLVEAEEDADLQEICREIRRRIPELDVYTADEFSYKSRLYWIARTGLGMSFGSSTLLGLIVGLVMVAQSLYAFVLDHQGDYATLKAMGAENAAVCQVLLIQSATIAAIAAFAGNLVTYLIWRLFSNPRLTIEISPWLLTASTGLAVTICLASSFLPFRRLQRLDPISVLQEA